MKVVARLLQLALLSALWFVCSFSCVLPGLTTERLCGRFDPGVSDACATCSKAACCSEERACRDSTHCAALYDCLGPCQADPACVAGCVGEHPNDDAGVALASCQARNCLADCASCAGGLTTSNPACDECARTKCCEGVAACIEDPACTEIVQCTANCAESGCFNRCILDEGLDQSGSPEDLRVSGLVFGVLNCVAFGCPAACQRGTAWDCVGNFNWPLAKEDTIELLVFANDAFGAPVTDVTVSACDPIDVDCANPLASSSTLDERGGFVLTLPTNTSYFRGYIQIDGPGRIPTIHYFNEPFLSDRLVGVLSLSPEQLDGFAATLDVTVDPNRGQLDATAYDCLDALGTGVQFDVGSSFDATSVASYGPNNTSTVDGRAQLGNLVVGGTTIIATLEQTGEPIAALNVNIRPGTLTTVRLSAAPAQ
jgi:hypothetical protein